MFLDAVLAIGKAIEALFVNYYMEIKEMSKHTPGPWPLFTVPTSVGSCHRIGQFPSRVDGEFTAAVVYADGIRPGIDDSLPRAQILLANAYLIAAAPELLEALKDLLIEFDLQFSNYEEQEVQANARAAIAKAEGEK